VHLSLNLAPLAIQGPELTDGRRAEALTRRPVQPGNVQGADRAHARRADLGAIAPPCAATVVRIGWRNLPLLDAEVRLLGVPIGLILVLLLLGIVHFSARRPDLGHQGARAPDPGAAARRRARPPSRTTVPPAARHPGTPRCSAAGAQPGLPVTRVSE
jgi:hypothetical protein